MGRYTLSSAVGSCHWCRSVNCNYYGRLLCASDILHAFGQHFPGHRNDPTALQYGDPCFDMTLSPAQQLMS